MEITRKEFLVLVAGGALAACGGSSPAGPSGDCEANGTGATIAHNTGHVLNIPKEDVIAGVAKSYDIRGLDSTHTHTVALTAADMQNLQKNLGISLTSSTDGNPPHNHSIAVVCL